MRGGLRKGALTVHVSVSVGWLGAVAAFLALAVAVWRSEDPALVRGGILAMDLTGRWVLLPLSLACLLTGVAQGLGTEWGLWRHYWVVSTLIINVVATAVLVLFVGELGDLADRASRAGEAQTLALRDPSPVVHAGAALAVLLLATTLSVVKPRGRTRHGQRLLRRQGARPRAGAAHPTPGGTAG